MEQKQHHCIVQNLYSKTFCYKNDQGSNSILYFFKLFCIHLINTLLSLLTFDIIKSINFDAKNSSFQLVSEPSYEFIAKKNWQLNM